MAQDVKIFRLGGMDTNSAVEFLDSQDWIESYNLRVSGTSEGESGIATNPESTSLITGTRSTGINKAIGAAGFEVTRTAYFFLFNSQLFHAIGKLDYDTGVQTILYTNLTDSASTNILTLNPTYYVTDIKLINDIYLGWTDGNMQPCLINLERLESGGYGTLTLEDLLVIKAQVLAPPTAVYGDDDGQSVNLMAGKLFQYRVQLGYQDNYYSAGSTWSKRPVPIGEATPAVGTNVTKNNNQTVSVDIGTDRVSTVNVWAHYDDLDWFLIKSATRAYILTLPTTIDIPDEVYEAYDPATNLYSIVFYNDGLYVDVDVTESDLDYDHVPLKCESMENVNGDILALAGITEGYDRPEPTVILSVSNYDPQINITVPSPASISVGSFSQYRIRNSHKRAVTMVFSGSPATGDVINVVVVDIGDYSVKTTYTYTVLSSQNGNLGSVMASLAAIIPSSAVDGVSQFPDYILRFTTQSYFQQFGTYITLFNATTGTVQSIHGLKSNSSYQLALAHFDKWGRYFPIVTGEDYVLNTESYAQTEGLTSQISWEISSDPPEDAVSAQWLITKNNTHENTLFINGVMDNTLTTADYFVFNINPLRQYNAKNSSSVLSYEYSKGDRCTFLFYYSSGTTPVWLNNPAIDVEVVGFEIDVNKNWLLKVRRSSSLSSATILDKNILLEVYTPRLRTIISEGVSAPAEQLFFEIGEEIPIENGAYTVTSGTITDGDVYFKRRSLTGAFDPNTVYDFYVEDFNFSDFYPSKFTSYGRPRSYADEVGVIERKASIRYSYSFERGSLHNGLSRFFPDSIYGDGDGETSSNYGWIRKISQRGNMLVVLQEIEVSYVPVNTTMVEDQVGNDQYALSLKLFNNARYSGLGFGIGNAKESYARNHNNIYFFDPNRSLPVRAGLDGISDISGKMSMFFKRTGQAAYEAGKKLISYFDVFNEEWLLTTETEGDVVASVPFSSTYWRYQNTFVIPPADITLTTQGTKGVATYNTSTGVATYTPNAGETGSDSFTFSFTPAGGVLTTVRACITITPGTTGILSFDFLDLTGVELSTLHTSNTVLITGNDIPVSISITGGEYSIDGAAYTSVTGTVDPEAIVSVRQTSSGSYSTQTDTVLTVSDQSATYSVTTKVAPDVTINYSNTQDLDPYVLGVMIYVLNGVEIFRTFQNDASSVIVPAGSLVQFRQVSFPAYVPWPDNGTGVNTARLWVQEDGVTLYDDSVTVQTIELHGSNYSWTALEGKTYTVTETTVSTSTGFSPYTLSVNTEVLNVGTELIDTTTGLPVITLTEMNFIGDNFFRFNLQDDANTVTANFPNTHSAEIFVTVTTAGGYLDTFSVLPTATGVATGIPKGDISVNISLTGSTPVACGIPVAYSGGQSYPTVQVITLGAGLGTVTLNFDAQAVPDKFIVVFDGVEVINTGYRGDASQQATLDAALATYGAPPEPIVGTGSGTANFVKSTATTTATLYVYAPITGTAWSAQLDCPV